MPNDSRLSTVFEVGRVFDHVVNIIWRPSGGKKKRSSGQKPALRQRLSGPLVVSHGRSFLRRSIRRRSRSSLKAWAEPSVASITAMPVAPAIKNITIS